MATNPMHQFEVYKIGPEIDIGGVNLSFTNGTPIQLLAINIVFGNTNPLLFKYFSNLTTPPTSSGSSGK